MVTFHKRAQKIQNPVVLLKMWKDAVHFCHPSTVEITHWRSNLLCFFFFFTAGNFEETCDK